jgi:hypothetical protein
MVAGPELVVDDTMEGPLVHLTAVSLEVAIQAVITREDSPALGTGGCRRSPATARLLRGHLDRDPMAVMILIRLWASAVGMVRFRSLLVPWLEPSIISDREDRDSRTLSYLESREVESETAS